jgi:DNA repair protein RecO (recombination protein O)
MLTKTRAIVLHQIKYGASSLIVTVYSEVYGRMSCMISGIGSKKSRTSAGLFQPLNQLELDIYYHQNRNIYRIKEVGGIHHYNSLPLNTIKSTIALFLSEVLYLSLREEESNPALFSFLSHAFQFLDTMSKGISNFHLWFMLHYSKFLGIHPGYYVDVIRSAKTEELKVFNEMPAEAYNLMQTLLSNPQGPPENSDTPADIRACLLERLIRYYTIHIDGFLRLKSYAVLQEVFK